jgi:hypothetical protein
MRASTKARLDNAIANYFRSQIRRGQRALSDPDRAAVLSRK